MHAHLLRRGRELAREELAVARLVVRQSQAAGQSFFHARQRGLGAGQLVATQQLERHPELAQHGNVARRGLELGLGAEQLQRAEAALLVRHVRVVAQLAQHIAAVFGEPHHALLVQA